MALVTIYPLSSSPFPFEADIISTVEFDSTGNYLATGDKGGRVVLFERNEMVRPPTLVSLVHPSESPLDPQEKGMRVQVLHRVPVTRTRVRLPQVLGNRREDQQDQVVQKAECRPLPVVHEWCGSHLTFSVCRLPILYCSVYRQDHQAMESI